MTTDVLLATYDGARWLAALLASLERQSCQEWRLVHRDDGSADGSEALVADWAQRTGKPLLTVEDGRGNLGATRNFAALLEASDADYFLPCDQDDLWEPGKVACLIERMKAREAELGPEAPLIVHSDLAVVDDALEQIHSSFWRYQRLILPRERRPWALLALQNCVTGCAMIGNAALRRLALPVPEQAMMHDWWLALVAASFGEIVSDPQPTVRYRQHTANTLGAKAWSNGAGRRRILAAPLASAYRARQILNGTRGQASAFLERYGERLSAEQRAFFCDYVCLREKGIFERKLFPARHGLWFDDAIRNLGLLIVI